MTPPNDELRYDDAMRVLSEDDCVGYLALRDVGRVAFEFGGRIELFPVNYAMEGSIIVLRTAPGTKLEAIPRTPVTFEVDSWEPRTGKGWSVVARGLAEEVTTSPGRVAQYLRWAPIHPVAPGTRWHWLAIKPTEITGRRFHVPPPAPERA